MRASQCGILGILAFTVVAVLSGCGGKGPTGNPGGGPNAVTVSNNQFTPSNTTVNVGATVTWTWASGAANHNVTFDDGPASFTKNNGTFSRTFSIAGTYGYHCTIHGAAMSGSVEVQ